DPDRNRTRDRIAGPALDQFPAVDVRQLEVDKDQGRYPVADEDVRLRPGAGVLERNSIAAELQQVQGRNVRIVLDQEDPPLPRHNSDTKRASLRQALRQLATGQPAAA